MSVSKAPRSFSAVMYVDISKAPSSLVTKERDTPLRQCASTSLQHYPASATIHHLKGDSLIYRASTMTYSERTATFVSDFSAREPPFNPV